MLIEPSDKAKPVVGRSTDKDDLEKPDEKSEVTG
jgi:hypothetical protein